MTDQAPAGWYADGRGDESYWDGAAWTGDVRGVLEFPLPAKKSGTIAKIGSAVKNAAQEKKAAKEEAARQHATNAVAAGGLVTTGVFGTSTVEVYENGFVRIAAWPENISGGTPKPIDKKTPYEKLRSIKFTQPDDQSSGDASAFDGAVGPAVAKLVKGGKGLLRASAPGMAMAGVAHVASNAARKSFLTIATDKQIHTLSNQTSNSVGLKTSNKGHNEVGLALEAAGNAALGTAAATPVAAPPPPIELPQPQPHVEPVTAVPGFSEQMRELAGLHREGILSDEEFAAAKASLLSGL